ncbi:peptidoglycan-binding domain-containing protein [Calothrix sp. NIES-2098]|uniref:peptidoglycan-binding domain-containing protein n=1 Tax=Calothrix sp. NIES-2098 TaxID=1954171 RepID=UPI000B600983|nr:peptidoglycan binding domain-containing protein [Calothrix sp. NIES-2098]
MNWKLLAVIPMLTLATAVPAYSQTNTKAPNTTNPTQVTQPTQPSNTTKKPSATKKPTTKANQTIALRLGSQGASVKVAQDFLKKQGFYTGNVNGVFDKQTRSAVIKFQKSKGLKADGIIGHRTLAAMK